MLKNIERGIKDFYKKDLESGGVTGIIVMLAISVLLAGLGFLLINHGNRRIDANRPPYYQEQVEYKERLTDLQKQIFDALSERNRTTKFLPRQIGAEDAAGLENTDDVYLFHKFVETERILEGIGYEHEKFDKTEAGRETRGKRMAGMMVAAAGKALFYPAVFAAVILTVQLIILPFSLKQ